MSYSFRRIAPLVFLLTLFGAFAFAVGQTPANGRQRPAVIKYDGDMAHMLSHLPGIYGSTIGLETDPQQPKSTVGFYLTEPTLADVLDAITRSSQIYQWREKDGFVEVVPLKGSSPLLDTYISNFRVDDAGEGDAINRLINLPEVQMAMKGMNLSYRDRLNAPAGREGKKVSISLEGVTLRQVLNTIANEKGTRFWEFRRDNRGFTISTSPILN